MSTTARNTQHDAEFAAGQRRHVTGNDQSAGGANLKKSAPTVLRTDGNLNKGRFSRGSERHYGSVKRLPTTTVNTTR